MSDSEAPMSDEALILAGAVRRWQLELREVDEQLVSLQQRRGGLVERIDTATRLVELVKSDAPGIPAPERPAPPPEAPKQDVQERLPLLGTPPPARVRMRPMDSRTSTWVEVVKHLTYAAPLGLTYAELRERVQADPVLAQRFAESEKGYYNALTRLATRHEIIKEDGRVFSPGARRTFLEEVAAGRIDGSPPVVGAYSPMGEAILDIVYARPGILSKDILRELRVDPEFHATLTPHTSGAYNIIARLVRRKQIIRREDGQCFPGPKMTQRDRSSKWISGRSESASPMAAA